MMNQLRFLFLLLAVTSNSLLIAQSGFLKDKQRVFELYQRGSYQEALTLARSLVAQKSDYELLITKSYCEEQLSMELAAIQTLTDALRIHDDETTLFFRRGVLEYRQGWYQQAISDFTNYISNPPVTTSGIIFQIDESGGEQLKIRSSTSLLAEAYSMRGLAYQQTGDTDRALDDFDEAILISQEPGYHVNRALLLVELKDTAQAVDDLNRALTIDPANPVAWYNLMIFDSGSEVPDSIFNDPQFYPMVTYRMVDAIQASDFELASRLIDPLLRSEFRKPETYLYAGRIAHGRTDYQQAINYYQEAIRQGVATQDIQALIGNSYFQQKEFAAAVSHYEIHLASHQQDVTTWFNAAVAYHRLDDLQNMCRCLAKSRALGMKNRQMTRMLELCE